MAYYLVDEHGNRVEGYSAQQFLNLLEQAIEQGSLENITADSGLIDQIRCCVGGQTHKIAFITQAQYNQLIEDNQIIDGAWYFITDDDTYPTLENLINTLQGNIDGIENRVDLLESFTRTPFTINGVNGTAIDLSEGLYLFVMNKTTFLLCVYDISDETSSSHIKMKSTLGIWDYDMPLIVNDSYIKYLEYDKYVDTPSLNKMYAYTRNNTTGVYEKVDYASYGFYVKIR